MSSLLAYSNVYRDPRGGAIAYTDVGVTFSSAQPLSNLSKPQLPIFAEFTEVCEFNADYGSEYTADVFAVLGHDLDDGMVVEFFADAVSIGTVTVTNYPGLAHHAILITDEPVTLQVLTVEITGGDALTAYQLGALWASASFRKDIVSSGFDPSSTSLSLQSWAQGTGYTAERPSYKSPRFEFVPLSKAEAIGPAFPNVGAILHDTGRHSEIILVPEIIEPEFSIYGLIDAPVGPLKRDGGGLLWWAGASIREQV